jgi:antitoxin (DNA-binding transcriptional repressor) of toxin-antitoxin stability system
MKTISAAEANRFFSSLRGDIACGEEIVVVTRGKAVARIMPVDSASADRNSMVDPFVKTFFSQS